MNVIDDYMLDDLLDDLKRIESDLQNSTIYSSTIPSIILIPLFFRTYWEHFGNIPKS